MKEINEVGDREIVSLINEILSFKKLKLPDDQEKKEHTNNKILTNRKQLLKQKTFLEIIRLLCNSLCT